jgi:glycerol-3-phosphate acyltransferase PlsY
MDTTDAAAGFGLAQILVLAGGYLLGSIPFGLILTRLGGFGDIRQIGSGNIGATNVLRTGNKALALATLLLDGGKGVATGLGTLLAINWPVGIAACLTWLVAAFLFRYSSLSALLAFALSPLYAYFLGDWPQVLFAILAAVLVWIRHHENITRLLRGEEPKIGRKNRSAAGG